MSAAWPAENGIDPKDSEAVRQFDRKRPKKMSNRGVGESE